MLKSLYKDVANNQDILWWYLGMILINKSLLNLYLPKKKSLKILDAGCGPGSMLPTLAEYGDVIGIDISPEALKFARKRGKVQKGNILALDFADESFDLVVCLDVLYHSWVNDENKALSELNRVLKKEGILLIREPAYNWLRGKIDIAGLTKRRFSNGRLKLLLEKSSFKILRISYANFFLFPIVLVLRISTSFLPNHIKASSNFSLPIPLLNKLLTKLMDIEAFLIKYVSLPFGSSLICVAQKV